MSTRSIRASLTICLVSLLCNAAELQIRRGGEKHDSNNEGTSTPDASTTLRAPTLGFVVRHQPLEVRALLGIPGACYASERLELPAGAKRIEFAPGHRWALVFREAGTAPVVWDPETGVFGEVEGIGSPSDLVGFAPSGTDLALYSIVRRELSVYRFEPENGQLRRSIHGGQDWAEQIVKLAVADGGRSILALKTDGRLYIFSDVHAPGLLIHESPTIKDFAFLPASTDFVVSDTISNEVALFSGDNGSYGRFLLLSQSNGLDGPSAIWTGDKSLIFVASEREDRLWKFDLASSSIESVSVRAQGPIVRLRMPKLLMLYSGLDEPSWLYQGADDQNTISFVPSVSTTAVVEEEER